MSGDVHVRFREGLGVRFPRATRLVICCRDTADQAMAAMRVMMERLKLTVNESKTRVCHLPGETFDFLGYTIGRCYSRETGRAYWGTRPSKKKVQRLCREISEVTCRRRTWQDSTGMITRLNRMLIGWANYFCLGAATDAYRTADRHVRRRLRRWLCAKHKVRNTGKLRFSDGHLERTLGLVRLETRRRNFPCANA